MSKPEIRRHDRGAAAVEFALVLPVLLLILFGIIDFGRALNAQITLTNAARAGAQMAAEGQPGVIAGTQQAAVGLSPLTVQVNGCPPGVNPSSNATVNVSYQFSFVTPLSILASLGGPLTMTASSVMPCDT